MFLCLPTKTIPINTEIIAAFQIEREADLSYGSGNRNGIERNLEGGNSGALFHWNIWIKGEDESIIIGMSWEIDDGTILWEKRKVQKHMKFGLGKLLKTIIIHKPSEEFVLLRAGNIFYSFLYLQCLIYWAHGGCSPMFIQLNMNI